MFKFIKAIIAVIKNIIKVLPSVKLRMTCTLFFCGPDSCFEKETYRPNSKIINDPEYIVVDNDTIEVKGKYGSSKYTQSKSRENIQQVFLIITN